MSESIGDSLKYVQISYADRQKKNTASTVFLSMAYPESRTAQMRQIWITKFPFRKTGNMCW